MKNENSDRSIEDLIEATNRLQVTINEANNELKNIQQELHSRKEENIQTENSTHLSKKSGRPLAIGDKVKFNKGGFDSTTGIIKRFTEKRVIITLPDGRITNRVAHNIRQID